MARLSSIAHRPPSNRKRLAFVADAGLCGKTGAYSSIQVIPLRTSSSIAVLLYRVYFRNQHAFIIGRDDFVAVDDDDAMVVARTLADACSDLCTGFELWQSERRVDTSPEQIVPDVKEIAARVQNIVVEREMALRESKWVVAESKRLLQESERLLGPPRA